uniref:EF-hand domain-containing protein n=1 Tax=Lotharella globosa TaxID=91324 RepID=A0A7S3YTC0_9EUKA
MKRGFCDDDDQFPAGKRISTLDLPHNPKNVQTVATALFDELHGKGRPIELKGAGDQLSWQGFSKLCETAGCDVVRARMLWNEADRDRSGYLDRHEFFLFCARQDIYPTVARMYVVVRKKNIAQKQRLMAADELFDFLDKNKDNMLSWEEFKVLCRGAGCNAKQAMVFWNATDSDESGELDRYEFRKFVSSDSIWPEMRRLYKQLQDIKIHETKEIAKLVFEELKAAAQTTNMDFKEDELSFKQFKMLCKKAGATSEEEAKRIFIQTDQDDSGFISIKEFYYFCARRSVDRSKDGLSLFLLCLWCFFWRGYGVKLALAS